VKNFVITLLIILVLCLGGYLVYDKIIHNNDDGDNTKEVLEDEKKYDLVEAKKLVDRYMSQDYMRYEILSDNYLSEEAKVKIAINNTKSTNTEYTCKEAFPEYYSEGEAFVNDDTSGSVGVCTDNYESSEIYDYKNVNSTYKKLFGNKKDLPKIMIDYDIFGVYAYSKTYDAFVELSCACGDFYSVGSSYYEVNSANIVDSTLEVVINYINFNLNQNSICLEQDDSVCINTGKEYLSDISNEDIKKLYSNAETQNKISKYKLIFRQSDTGYYLDSISKLIYE